MISGRIARDDQITPQVLEIVKEFMLVPEGERCHAGIIHRKWRKVEEDAELWLQEQSTAIPTSPVRQRTVQRPSTSSPIRAPEQFLEQRVIESPPPEGQSNNEVSPGSDMVDGMPVWPVKDALAWCNERRGKSRREKSPAPEYGFKNDLKGRNGREYVFMIDDSSTMLSNWHDVADTVELLSEVVFDQKADNKIDVCFVGSSRSKCSSDSQALRDFILDQKPSIQSGRVLNMEEALERYLAGVLKRFRGPLSLMAKPVSLYIVTDGLYQPASELKTPIRDAVDELQRLKKPKHLGIQLLQAGDNAEGAKRLQGLDRFLTEENQQSHTKRR